jgi:hypothetical protein
MNFGIWRNLWMMWYFNRDKDKLIVFLQPQRQLQRRGVSRVRCKPLLDCAGILPGAEN